MWCQTKTVIGGAGLLAIAATSSLHADLEGYWNGRSDYTLFFSHMPDFDQVRTFSNDPPVLGLANNGSMYCVPTSIMNLGGYVANHGHPDAIPGNEAWQLQSNYNHATLDLAVLGSIAGTDPFSGTTLNGMHEAAKAAIPLDRFTVVTQGRIGSYMPNIDDFAEWSLNGSIVAFCHGWYAQTGTVFGLPVLDRNGGHCITFSGASKGIFSDAVFTRDPADNNSDAFTQSTFTTRTYEFTRSPYIFGSNAYYATRIEPSLGNDTTFRIVDGYTKVTPKAGVTLTYDRGIILQYAPGNFTQAPNTIELVAIDDDITSMVFGPDDDRIYVMAEDADGNSFLLCSRLVDPDWVEVSDFPFPNVQSMMFADNRDLIVLADGAMTQYQLFESEDGTVGLEPIASTNVADNALMGYDHKSHRAISFDPGEQALQIYSGDVGGDGEFVGLPLGGPLPDEGNFFCWDESRDAAWIGKPGSDAVFLATPIVGAGEADVEIHVIDPDVTPIGIMVDDMGHVLLNTGDKWQEYRLSDESGEWTRVGSSPFDGMPVGQITQLSRSHTNYDPDVHLAEEWINIFPTSFGEAIVDCNGDLDNDRVVGFGDLLMILSAWGPCPTDAYCDADLDYSGDVGFGDVVSLLASWGDCPE